MDELETMASMKAALLGLPDDAARVRVLRWVTDAIGLAAQTAGPNVAAADLGEEDSLTGLLDQAQPVSRSELILVVSSWLERSAGGADWTSQALNDQLKQLGEGVPNITDALSTLMTKKPALVRQTRKSGKAQQARKRYLLTSAGRTAVTAMSNRRGGKGEKGG